MNAEFQAFRMHIICDRLETSISSRRRKPVRHREKSAIARHTKRVVLWIASRIHDVPALVDHHVLPAELLQMGCHPIDIRLELCLGNCASIGIPAIPSHGWSRSELSIARQSKLSGSTYEEQNEFRQQRRTREPHSSSSTRGNEALVNDCDCFLNSFERRLFS